MPQPFRNAVITNAGARLITRAQAGEIKICFTRVATGCGIYSEEEKTMPMLQEMGRLKDLKGSYPISSVEVYSDHSVKVTALISNQDPATGETLVHEGYFINEMGLYAKEADGGDSTEALYSIAVTDGENGDFMPPFNGYSPAQIVQEYYATVNNSAEVSVESTGAALLREEFEAFRSSLLSEYKALRAIYEGGSGALRVFSLYSAGLPGRALHRYRAGEEALVLSGVPYEYDSASGALKFPGPGTGGWQAGGLDAGALPIASRDALGCVKAGDGLTVGRDGTLSVDPRASAEAAAGLVGEELGAVTGQDMAGLFAASTPEG